jgi:oligosaccharide repeat unit polymerase
MYYRHLEAYQIIIAFYSIFIVLALLGKFLIPYPAVSLITWLIWICYIFSISLGAFLGRSIKLPVIKGFVPLKSTIIFCIIITSLAVIYTWLLIIAKYGAISYIIANAYSIRINTIGSAEDSFIPVYISYVASLIYASFTLILAFIGKKYNFKFVLLAIFMFVLIFLADLQTFGRIGILYGVFSIFGFLIIFKVRKILSLRNFLIFFLIFFIMTSPRIIRRGGAGLPFIDNNGNDSLSYVKYEVPVILNEFVDTYYNYFSSFYALDDYVMNQHSKCTLGWRTFTPIVRIINRFFGKSYISTIDIECSNLPTKEYNIYTVIRDFYGDFSIIGIIVLPFLIGVYFGIIFRFKSVIYDAQKIYLLGWLFYTPIYNAFSFGGFLISFIFLVVCSLVIKKNVYKSINKEKLISKPIFQLG